MTVDAENAGTERPVVALLGAGVIAAPHVHGWAALGAEIRIFSLSGAADLAATSPNVTAVDSIEAAFDGANVVDICTPTPTHPTLVRAAIAAGLDVFCEKPLARTGAEAEALVAEAAAAGVRLMPDHVVRWFPAYAALHGAVERLGKLAVLRFSRENARPEQPWFHDVGISGGIVLDQMIHDLDQAYWLAGDVVEVSGQQSPPTADNVTSAQVVLLHASGAISYVRGLWGPPGTPFRTVAEIAGTAGLLQHDSTTQPEMTLNGVPETAAASPYHLIIEDFWNAIRGGPQPRLTAADGAMAVQIAEAALEAIATGATVKLTQGQQA